MTIDASVFLKESRQILLDDECSLSYFLFADHFSELDLLRRTVEDLLKREEDAEVDRLDLLATEIPPERRNEYWAENHPYWWDQIIAPQFRASFFTTLMAALELHLDHFVRDAGVVAKAPISFEELKGATYPRARKYLARFCGIESPGEAEWQRVLQYYSVRNAIVHNGGFIKDGDRGQAELLAAAVLGLSLRSGSVELEAEFNAAAHSDCHKFLFNIWGELVLLCRRVKSAGGARDQSVLSVEW